REAEALLEQARQEAARIRREAEERDEQVRLEFERICIDFVGFLERVLERPRLANGEEATSGALEAAARPEAPLAPTPEPQPAAVAAWPPAAASPSEAAPVEMAASLPTLPEASLEWPAAADPAEQHAEPNDRHEEVTDHQAETPISEQEQP